MKSFIKKIIIAILVLIFFAVPPVYPSKVKADVNTWQKGMSIYPVSTNDFSTDDFKTSIRNLKETGANYVSLVFPIYQKDLKSTDIFAWRDTPTDESLISAIRYAHSIGLKIILKPHLEAQVGGWRALINPDNREAWFNSYQSWILRLATIAQQNSVEGIILGTELYHMASTEAHPQNEYYWNRLIDATRAIYSGQLTYDAQFSGHLSEKDEVNFWTKLDFIGLSAYWNLAYDKDNPTLEDLIKSWKHHYDWEIKPFYDKWKKDIVFTEVGYRSVEGHHKDPWSYDRQGEVDFEGQAKNYEALFSFWSNIDFFKGIHLWTWYANPNAGGTNNTDYTPQNKPAEKVLAKWYGGVANPQDMVNETPIVETMTISSTSSPTLIRVKSEAVIKTDIKSRININNAIIDLEIYNSGNQKVFQKIFKNENLPIEQTMSYVASWVPETAGSYRMSVGVFDSSWSKVHKWQLNSLELQVSNNIIMPPSPQFQQSAKNNSSIVFNDDFNRSNNNDVGNGWIEHENDNARIEVQNNKLFFTDTSNEAVMPMIYKNFPISTSGKMTWEFDFNWTKIGEDNDYSLYLQLGDDQLMSNNTIDEGVGVNIRWGNVENQHERLVARIDGSEKFLREIKGLATIKVVADINKKTYSVFMNNAPLGQDLEFKNKVDINTVRIFTNKLNDQKFWGRTLDNMKLTILDGGEDANYSNPQEVQLVQANGSPSFEINTMIDKTNPRVNQNISINTSLKSNISVLDSIVNVEIYDSNDQRIFQRFFTGQNINSTQKNYNLTYTPVNKGEYRIALGIFTSDWEKSIYWNQLVKKFKVETSEPVSNPQKEEIEIAENQADKNESDANKETNVIEVIEPTSESIDGLFEVKAKVGNLPISEYSMYWKVDEGQMNMMNNENDNKTSKIDATHWTWKDIGPYKITLIAQNNDGLKIGEKSFNIITSN